MINVPVDNVDILTGLKNLRYLYISGTGLGSTEAELIQQNAPDCYVNIRSSRSYDRMYIALSYSPGTIDTLIRQNQI